jgi:cytochrome P450
MPASYGQSEVVHHPHHIRHILQQKTANYDRSTASFKMARNLFGRGLATVEGGPEWRGMRRMMQPSFHYQRVASMAEHMVAVIHERLDRWDEMAAAGEVLDINVEMRRLTLRVVELESTEPVAPKPLITPWPDRPIRIRLVPHTRATA